MNQDIPKVNDTASFFAGAIASRKENEVIMKFNKEEAVELIKILNHQLCFINVDSSESKRLLKKIFQDVLDINLIFNDDSKEEKEKKNEVAKEKEKEPGFWSKLFHLKN